VTFRLWKRLDNARSNNDNFDIADFMGHGDLQASYRADGNELSCWRAATSARSTARCNWAGPSRWRPI
jgi:phospholipase A1